MEKNDKKYDIGFLHADDVYNPSHDPFRSWFNHPVTSYRDNNLHGRRWQILGCRSSSTQDLVHSSCIQPWCAINTSNQN